MQIITFEIAGEWYGLDVAEVQAVDRETTATPVPGVPSHVVGVVDWQGKLVAVLDLRPLFGLPAREEGGRGFLVVAREKWYGTALLVDTVEEILEVDSSSVEPPLSTLPRAGARCLVGEVRRGDKLIGILDLGAVVEAATSGIAH